ncbi:protein FAR1-RELATED SEQUENCE 5-like [Salvia hispanica]|uniref:protein FAR1-RELATED SEQUENCE 5-like n=1 Tax=Salvia hispanica TaxID=49212 RepID=UPI002009C9AC|nr:protein FAR1-RELATED SEQUENCE 5-like [Salvia hispanica]
MEEVVVVPECSQELKPFAGQMFKSLDFAVAFYNVYARAVGFDTRKQGLKKVDNVATWHYVVCSRAGKLSKRCGCKAGVSFKYFSEGGNPGYVVHQFHEVHNHSMVEVHHQHFMSINWKLDEVHHKFILDCSRANIGPTMTFKVLKEVLGGFGHVRCTVGDIRNASRDLKAYAHGFDVQMVLNDMARKKELSDSFTYHYEVNESNQLVALFWCDGLSKRNYQMFGDIVAFDSTYNTNMYRMIFTPFTGKDNHGKPVTFAAGLVCNEKTGAFAWLFQKFIECMGVAPKMIVTDQDLGMRSAIEEILVGTRHRWCMWHIMYKLAAKVPNRLLKDENFKKDFNACVWSDLLEPEEFEEKWNTIMDQYCLEEVDWFSTLFEYRQLWIPAYFRYFPLGSMIRTTSISESENSFYKNFLKPSANIAEFYLNFNNALEFQRNGRAKLDYEDSTNIPIWAADLPIERHAAKLYTDSMFRVVQEEIVDGHFHCRIASLSSTEMLDSYKVRDRYSNTYRVRHDKEEDSYTCECKLLGRQGYPCSHLFMVFKNNGLQCIPAQYCEGRWMKTPLAKAVHGVIDDTLPTRSIVDDRVTLSNEAIGLFYGFLRRYEKDTGVLRSFIDGMKQVGDSLKSGAPIPSTSKKTRLCEEYYGIERPESVDVHPPDVMRTKGSCSDKPSRMISQRDKAIKEASRPLRRCRACDELCHHDTRTCPTCIDVAKENEKRKGKRKY